MATHQNTRTRKAVRAIAGAGALVGVAIALGGCVANSSNPVVSISSATLREGSADVTLRLENPGGRDLTVESLGYELSHGEIGFPLASGAWAGAVELRAGGEAELPLTIEFDSDPIEEDSDLLHLGGTLGFTDHTGFLGMSSMDLTSTTFLLETRARRAER